MVAAFYNFQKIKLLLHTYHRFIVADFAFDEKKVQMKNEIMRLSFISLSCIAHVHIAVCSRQNFEWAVSVSHFPLCVSGHCGQHLTWLDCDRLAIFRRYISRPSLEKAPQSFKISNFWNTLFKFAWDDFVLIQIELHDLQCAFILLNEITISIFNTSTIELMF